MTNTKDIIIKLKDVRDEKGLSYNDILSLLEKNGDYLAKSTIARVFSEGSEDLSFRYEETIRPIANALLDIETIEDTDDMDVKAMKSLLKYKIQRIEELERQIEHLTLALANEKVSALEQIAKVKEEYQAKIDFRDNQIVLKDNRIDFLMQEGKAMLDRILKCSKCEGNK